jgi:phosphate starvation-inducible PhoH-like protein
MTQLILAEEGIESLYGTRDENLRGIEKAFGVTLQARGNRLQIEGEPDRAERAESLLSQLSTLLEKGYELRPEDVETAVRVMQEAPEVSLVDFFLGDDLVGKVRRVVKPRSLRQQLYLQAMAEHDLVLSIGPAGTGKTYLAVAMAAVYLLEKRVRRIVLARPAVEAGEKLGFLPGDLVEKVNPYLRPLYDALYDILGFDKVDRLLERGTIEVAPLAFMRGRTLNESFIILDEAQNTTGEQMKMFLTRVGNHSKAVVNGDVTQVDLPSGKVSGLRQAQEVLAGVEGIKFIHFTDHDVVRHPLVQKIVLAYERHEKARAEATSEPARAPRE